MKQHALNEKRQASVALLLLFYMFYPSPAKNKSLPAGSIYSWGALRDASMRDMFVSGLPSSKFNGGAVNEKVHHIIRFFCLTPDWLVSWIVDWLVELVGWLDVYTDWSVHGWSVEAIR